MDKEDKTVIIMNDKDYARLLERVKEDGHEELLAACAYHIKVVADAKEEKRLWKAKKVTVYDSLPLPCKEEYTDVMELTEEEAFHWYGNWVGSLNKYETRCSTVYSGGLFCKKDGEWVAYQPK